MYLNTPLLKHPIGDQIFYLKMECWQPSGSFKLRGMTHLAQHYQAEGAQKLVSSSGGNAGYSAAWAARELGIPITVVVPHTTAEQVRTRIQSLGAEIIVHGSVWEEAHQRAKAIAVAEQGALVHPFEHPLLWEGHASIIAELDMPKPEAVVVSVGGGGLMIGVLQGLHQRGWTDVPLYAAETAGAASYAAALNAGQVVRIPAITSIAKTLGANQVSETAFNWSKKHDIRSLVVSDEEALLACQYFARDFRTLVEPACGAALSAMYIHQKKLAAAQKILVIVCGGIGVEMPLFPSSSK